MKTPQFLRRFIYPASVLLPGILSIQAGNVSLPLQTDRPLPAPILSEPIPSAMLVEPIETPSAQSIENWESNAKLLSTPLSSLYIQFNGMKSFLTNSYIMNPTGGPVRRMGMDAWGGGEYLARRYDPKTRIRSWHNAIDYIGKPGQAVRAPISGDLRRIGSGKTSGAMILGNIDGKKFIVRMLHCDIGVKNGFVAQGQTIGRVKNLGRWYRGMLSHVHLEVLEMRGSKLKQRNPAQFVRNNP